VTVQVGQIIDGKYRIVRLIGQGGMGAVYEGLNTFIDRRVAIKVMLPDIGTAAVGRFEQEARAAGRIGNDHILEILDMGRLADGSHYMVMEFLDGESLEARLEQRGALQPQELAPIALQLLEALGAAHRAGVLHRDLKPDNVFLVRQKAGHRDFVKLIDFGISKFGQDQALNLTKTGTMVGTPYYMAPEQARGKGPVDSRADLYAVGVILYQCVSGQLPFVADSFNDLLFKIVLEAAPPVSTYAPFLDAHFASIIHRAMAREAADRYQSAEELAEAIMGWLAETGNKLPSVAPSYKQPTTSRAPVSSAVVRGETPLPMSTLAVPTPGTLAVPSASGLGTSATGTMPLSQTAPVPSASFGPTQSMGRGTTPPTPNTFGRTAAAEIEARVATTSLWKSPLLWAAVGFGAFAIGLGAFLLTPSAPPAETATSPVEGGADKPSHAATPEIFHGDQFRPEAVKPGAPPAEPAPVAPAPVAPAKAPPTEEPAPVAKESKGTKAAPRPAARPAASPPPPAKTAEPASAPPANSGGKDSNRFYFGY